MTAPPDLVATETPEPQAPPVDPAAQLKEKLRKIRGPQYPGPDAAEGPKLTYVSQLWDEREPDTLAGYRQATRNLCYLHGRQRITWTSKRQTWDDLPLIEGEHWVTMNYWPSIVRSRIQRMFGGPVQFSISPENTALDAKDRATVAMNFAHARLKQTNVRAKAEQAYTLAMCAGVAALKSFWNPTLGPLEPATMQQVRQGPDGAPVLDDQGQPVIDTIYVDENEQPVETPEEAFQVRPGDTDTAVRTEFNIRRNADATGWTVDDGLRWLIDREVVPLSVARERYPEVAERIQAYGGQLSSLTYERIASAAVVQRAPRDVSTPSGQSKTTESEEKALLTEYWELPTLCFPKGRLIVGINADVVAYDDAFPDDVFPYRPVYDEPAPLTSCGRPSVNDLVAPQDVINRQWTAIVAEFEATGIGRYIGFNIPGMPDQISPENYKVALIPWRPGVYGNRGIDQIIKRDTGPTISGDRWRMIGESKSTMFDLAAHHEVTRGQIPPGIDSGVAIQQLLEQEAGQLNRSKEALKESLIGWLRDQIAIARKRYAPNVTRWLPVDRPDLGYQIESMTGADLPDPQTLTIELGQFQPYFAAAHKAEVKEALQLQLIGPREALKALDLGLGVSAVYDSQTRQYARARTLATYIEQGKFSIDEQGQLTEQVGMSLPSLMTEEGTPFTLPDDDDHAIHLEVLDEIVLDETKPWPMRQAAMSNKAERRAVMTLKAQQQAAAQPQEPQPVAA